MQDECVRTENKVVFGFGFLSMFIWCTIQRRLCFRVHMLIFLPFARARKLFSSWAVLKSPLPSPPPSLPLPFPNPTKFTKFGRYGSQLSKLSIKQKSFQPSTFPFQESTTIVLHQSSWLGGNGWVSIVEYMDMSSFFTMKQSYGQKRYLVQY